MNKDRLRKNNSQQIANIADSSYRVEGTAVITPVVKTQSYGYDANENMVFVNTATKTLAGKLQATNSRKMLWDEENRLLSVSDNGFVSNYWYDAAGERTVKMSGDGEGVSINGLTSAGRTGAANFTAYISPYLVVGNGGNYTKHIYMGSQRIVSKLSGSEIFSTSPVTTTDLTGKYTTLTAGIKNRYDSLGVAYKGVEHSGTIVSSSSGATGTYYYHSDHLGSSSLITDPTGAIAQHIEYVPFGETFIDERNSNWHTPYLFNAKERDEETGLTYYGARYYDAQTSGWMSVDPLAEKYPGVGSYVYCGNNPINRTDPTGLKWEDKNKAIALKATADSEIKARQQSIKDDQEKLKDSNLSEEQKQQYNNNINASTERITWLEGSKSDIDKLDADQDHTFILNDAGGGLSGNVTQNSDKKISINAPTNALAFHEIKHLSQSLKSGKLTFVNGKLQNAGTTNIQKGNNEVAAYRAQFAFKGAIPDGVNLKKPSDVTYDLVSKMTNDKGKLLYPFMSKDKK